MEREKEREGEKRREGTPACEDDGLLPIPGGIVSHYFGVEGDVVRRELWQLIGLGVDPAQRLHVLVGV